jgi:hypothetical protein
VRIAFSGSHRVGKSTLVEHLAEALPQYATVEEPYYLLEEDGYECAENPSLEDFEAQLERSLEAIGKGARNVLFDRCPVDILAYLETHDDADSFQVEIWIERVREAMSTLDLVVFVPVENPDRIRLPPHEDRKHRAVVDQRLRELVLEDALNLGSNVLIVQGDPPARSQQVLARMREPPP